MRKYKPSKKLSTSWCLLLEQIFEEFQATADFADLHLSEIFVHQLVNSFLIDIKRYQAPHDIDIADHHKRIAFLTKWIVFTRPIQYPPIPLNARIARTLNEELPMRPLANEFFAIHVMYALLKIEPTDKIHPLSDYLLYTFKHRHVSARNLCGIVYLLDELMKS